MKEGHVTTGGRSFTCGVPNKGPLGPVEGFLMGTGSATLRKSIIKLESGDFTLTCEDLNGDSHDVVKMPIANIATFNAGVAKKGQQVTMILWRMLAVSFGFAFVIALATSAKVGFRELRHPAFLLFIGGGGFVGGLVISFFMVLVPGVLKIKRNLTKLIFLTGDGREFLVLVSPEQMAGAVETLRWAGIDFAGPRSSSRRDPGQSKIQR